MSRPLLSRNAEAVYWMSRYVERAENVARWVEAAQRIALDDLQDAKPQWRPLVEVGADLEPFGERYSSFSEANVLQFVTFDEENPNSILRCVQAARENARSVRELISEEMWEQLNTLYWDVRTASQTQKAQVNRDLYGKVKTAVQLFDGLMLGTMPRGEAWWFAILGRHLERADKATRLLDVKYYLLFDDVGMLGTPVDLAQWRSVLISAGGLQAYRRRFGRLDSTDVARLLLVEEDFPRSALHCLRRASSALSSVGAPEDLRWRIDALTDRYDRLDVAQVVNEGMHEFLDATQSDLNDIHTNLSAAFFQAGLPERDV